MNSYCIKWRSKLKRVALAAVRGLRCLYRMKRARLRQVIACLPILKLLKRLVRVGTVRDYSQAVRPAIKA